MSSAPDRIGRYEIKGLLGEGGMGRVYRAWDPMLSRTVALKVIAQAAGGTTVSDAVSESRFLREARLAARIVHPAVVAIHDIGLDEDQLFVVMELIEGESLKDRMARGAFPSRLEAMEITTQVAEALAAAHERDVVHRDIKPGNILLASGGGAKVSDFGIAKALGDGTELTRSGGTLGSPSYMSPEQVRGEVLDGRADVFSLGVVLFEMLFRQRPFPADTITTLVYQILHADPFADAPPGVVIGAADRELLAWALAKDRNHRIKDAATFAVHARALAAGADPEATTDLGSRLRQAVMAVGPPAAPAAPAAAPGPQPMSVTPAAAILEHATLESSAVGLDTSGPVQARRGGALLPFLAGLAVAALVLGWWFLGPGKGDRLAALEATPVPEVVVATATPEPPPTVVVSPTVSPVVEATPGPTPPDGPDAVLVPPLATPIVSAIEAPSPTPRGAGPTGGGLLGQTPTAGGSFLVPSVTPLPPTPTPRPPTPRPRPTATSMPTPTPTSTPTPRPTPTATPTPPITETYICSEAAIFEVDGDTRLFVDGVDIGIADRWDDSGRGTTYPLDAPGRYIVRMELEEYHTGWVLLIARSSAEEEYCEVETELIEIDD